MSKATGHDVARHVYFTIGDDWLPNGGIPADFEMRVREVSFSGNGIRFGNPDNTYKYGMGSASPTFSLGNIFDRDSTWVLDFTIRNRFDHSINSGTAKQFTLRARHASLN